MAADYHQLLDATLAHLQTLQERGVRRVRVQSDTLKALKHALPPRRVLSAALSVEQSLLPAASPAAPIIARQDQSRLPASEARPPNLASPPEPMRAPVLTAAAPLSAEAKAQAMAALRQRALVCVKCPTLAATRKNVVFGVGSIEAQIMFVGEAPGADEDVQGEPFVGRAGQLLTRIIQAMGLTREQVYIGNILKCRPDTPNQAYGNRAPTPEEMQTCLPYLLEQIEIVQPRVLVALGATAVKGLLQNPRGITQLRGQWQTFRGIPLMPTFHPSYLLRPENADKKLLVWQDMLAVMEKAGLPVSDKQRGFFQKKDQ